MPPSLSFDNPQSRYREMENLYIKIGRWLYEKPNRKRASIFVDKLKNILTDDDAGTILGLECFTIIAAFEKDVHKEIEFREKLIQKMFSYLSMVHTHERPEWDMSWSDLRDDIFIYVNMLIEEGRYEEARQWLNKAFDFCEKNKIPFEIFKK